MRFQPARDLRSDDPGAHDQHGLGDQPAGSRGSLDKREHGPAEGHGEQREQPRPHEVVRDHLVGEDADHRDRHRGDRDCADDGHDPVEHERPQAGAVEPAQVEEQDHQRRQRKQRRLQRVDVADRRNPATAAESDRYRGAQQQEVERRAQDAPALALQGPLKSPVEAAAAQWSGLRRRSRPLPVQRYGCRGLLADVGGCHPGRAPVPYPLLRMLSRFALVIAGACILFASRVPCPLWGVRSAA